MKLDIVKAISAPFSSTEEKLSTIYLTAFGFFAAMFVIPLISEIIIGLFMALLEVVLGKAITSIISIILLFICFLGMVVIFFIPFGYIIQTIQNEAQNQISVMPAWKGNIKKFAWKGFMAFLVYILFMFIYLVGGSIPLVLLAFLMKAAGNASEILGNIIGVISFIYGTLFLLYLFIALPMAIVAYGVENSFFKAFNIFKITWKILTHPLESILTIVILCALVFLIFIINIMLTCTIIGILLIPLINYFILMIIVLNMFTQIYKETPPILAKNTN